MKNYTGFTLIELMITLAIAAIVMTIGVPSFQETIRQNRLTTGVNNFVTALNLTRSEAIRRGTRVTLCKSADSTSCATTGGYEQGLIVFVGNMSAGGAATTPAASSIIRLYENLPAGMTLTTAGSDDDIGSYVSYTPDGFSRQTSGAFLAGALNLCKSGSGKQIVLNSLGRIKIVSQISCS